MAEEKIPDYAKLLNDKSNLDSLYTIYHDAKPTNKGTSRRFSQDVVITKMVEKCKLIKNDREFVLMLLSTAEELKTNNGIKTKTFRDAIREFICRKYKIENKKAKIGEICNTLLPTLKGNNDQLSPNMSGIQGLENPLKFGLSVAINKFKPRWNKVSQHIWLGKLPIQKDFELLLKECNPALVVSANNKSEPQTSLPVLNDFVPPHWWESKKIDQVFLDLFIDYGRPYRNADFKKYKFNSKTDWDSYLDKLYTQIYHACVLMKDKIDKGQNIFIHCKAGKGRSVTALAVFYMLNPSELIPGKKSLTVDEVWVEMLKARPHIDQDPETKQAVQDCYNYIKQTLEPQKKSVDDAKKYFNPQYKAPQNIN